MDGPTSTPPTGPHLPSATTAGKSWADGVLLPETSILRPLLRADADTVVEASAPESRIILNHLFILATQLRRGDIVLPSSVSTQALSALVGAWRANAQVRVGKNSHGEFIVTSENAPSMAAAQFVLLSPDHVVLTAGILTDRDIDEDWPEPWRSYDDCAEKRILDHCCGGGAKVTTLRAKGIDAHGVDICSWGSETPFFLHFGRAERLPFANASFDRVESRMGVFLWGQDSKQTCRDALAEIARVSVDGGIVRIASVREKLLRTLVSERADLFFSERQLPDYGAFELRVRRGA